MTPARRHSMRTWIFVVAVALLGAACGDDGGSADGAADPSGPGRTAGSTTTGDDGSPSPAGEDGTGTPEPVDGDGPSRDACPFFTDDEVTDITGVEPLTLGKVLFPGDTSDGFEVPFTSCAWSDDVQLMVLVVVHREASIGSQFAEYRAELEDGADPVRDVPGPWDTGFVLESMVGSQVFALSGDVGIEAQILGAEGFDAVPLALELWERL